MTRQAFVECVEEMSERADPTPAVDAATRAMRRHRSEQLDEVDAVVNGGSFYAQRIPLPHRLAHGHHPRRCRVLQADPPPRRAHPTHAHRQGRVRRRRSRRIITAPARRRLDANRSQTCSHATNRCCAGGRRRCPTPTSRWCSTRGGCTPTPIVKPRPHRSSFDSRAVHLSTLMDGIGVIDGTLDPEGLALAERSHPSLLPAVRRRDPLRRPTPRRRLDHDRPDRHREPRRRARQETPQAQSRRHHQLRRPRLAMAPGAGRQVHHRCRRRLSAGRAGAAPLGGALDTDLDRTHRLRGDGSAHGVRLRHPPLHHQPARHGHRLRPFHNVSSPTRCSTPCSSATTGAGGPAAASPPAAATPTTPPTGSTTAKPNPTTSSLLCWFHHHLLHEQHWSIEPLGGGHFNLNDPHGGAQLLRPPLVGLALPTQPRLPLDDLRVTTGDAGRASGARQRTASRSTTKTSVSFGAITPPAPAAP